jgi:hypothetical protein
MKFLIFLLILNCATAGFAQTIDVLFEGESDKRLKTQASQEIVDEAIERTSLKYISEIIGDAKAQKNLSLIRNKVIKESGKYVLYIKTDKLKADRENPSKKVMNVSLKLSLDNLRKILLSNGLLYKTEGSPKVLPLIVFDDRKNSEFFSWWMGSATSSYLRNTTKSFYSKIRQSFQQKMFYSALPIENNYATLVPEALRLENPRLQDALVLGEYFSSDIIVKGKVRLQPVSSFSDQIEIIVQLLAYQTSNGRLIADVKRKYKTEFGSFKTVVSKKLEEETEAMSQDLVSQVFSAWQSGTFGSSLIRLTLYGPIDYKDLMSIKTKVNQLKEVRRIRERFFARKKVSFEIDASVLPKELAEILKTVRTNKYSLKFDDMDSSELEFDLISRR